MGRMLGFAAAAVVAGGIAGYYCLPESTGPVVGRVIGGGMMGGLFSILTVGNVSSPRSLDQ